MRGDSLLAVALIAAMVRCAQGGAGASNIAGGGLQVCNKTPVMLHMTLAQVGPLYYQNWVEPGHCMTRNGIGNVWFTIEVKVSMEENEYTDTDVALPIAGTVCLFVSAACIGLPALAEFALSSGFVTWVSGAMTSLRSAAFLCRLATRASQIRNVVSGAIGLAGAAGISMDIKTMLERTSASWGGFYANCKSWAIETDMPTILHEGKVYADLGRHYSFWYTEEGNYDCHSDEPRYMHVDLTARAEPFNTKIDALIDQYRPR